MSKIIDFTIYSVLILIIISIAYTSFIVYTGDYIFAYGEGVSNEPYVENGSVLIHKNVDSIETVEEGDLVSYESNCFVTENEYILHMVIDKRSDGLVTMGLNNSNPDQVVYFGSNNNKTTADLEGIEDYYPVIDEMNVSDESCEQMITDENIRGVNKFRSGNDALVGMTQYLRKMRYSGSEIK